MAIQAAALMAAAAYYLIPQVQPALASVAEFKKQVGLPFAAVSTALAGVVLPEAARAITRQKRSSLGDLGYQAMLYAILGVTIDLLYRGLAELLGGKASIGLVAEKILVDQLVYSPLFSIPLSTFVFLFRDVRFDWGRVLGAVRNGEFAKRYVALLITCWGFWGPVLAAVYAMPSNLQFVMFLCAEGAWSLLLVTVAVQPGRDQPQRGEIT